MANTSMPILQRLRVITVIVVFYMILRTLVYHWVKVESYGDWIQRDFIMNLPRILCLSLALWLGLKNWKPHDLGFHSKGFGIALIILAVELLAKGYFGGIRIFQQLRKMDFSI